MVDVIDEIIDVILQDVKVNSPDENAEVEIQDYKSVKQEIEELLKNDTLKEEKRAEVVL